MNNLNEIYVATKDKEYILAKIEGLCQKYNSRNGVNNEQRKALFRNYCHDTVEVFDECFETTMLGITRCISKVEGFRKLDNIDIGAATLVILKLLVDLKELVSSMIPIKDLPSCKELIGLSAEDLIAKAKDLVKSDIVKVGIGAILLGSKVNDVIKIEDVKNYYQRNLEELQNEIKIKGKPMSLIEQFLLDKFSAEIGYCNLALVKAGIGITEELKDMAEIGKKHIERYENLYKKEDGNLLVS
jgi:hypothetical protein